MITRSPWDVNEIAFVWWARKLRGKKTELELLSNIIGRTKPAISTLISDYHIYCTKGSTPSALKAEMFPKVDLFLAKIQTKEYVPIKEQWEEKLAKFSPSIPTVEKIPLLSQDPGFAAEKTADKPRSAYSAIVEWIFLHEDNFSTQAEWRKAFTDFLRNIL